MIRLKDVAKKAGVSEATVSLSLNNNKMVKDETRERVKQIAKELGYTPNSLARSLVKQKSGTIGLIVPDIESAYYGKLVRCIDEQVREAGYSLLLAISDDKPSIERKITQKLISDRVEGLFIVPVNQENTEITYLKQLNQHGIPLVFVTANYPDVEVPYVMVDLEEGTYRLVRYLLDLGHRDIVFLGGSPAVITTAYRLKGCIRAYDERQLNWIPNQFIECKRINYQQACEITEKLIRSGRKMDAIITINDMMALGVTNSLTRQNIRVPEDVSVAGYDDIIFSTISAIPITTVRQDIEQMSMQAVNLLMQGIQNNSQEKGGILIKPELIIRDSTGLRKSID